MGPFRLYTVQLSCFNAQVSLPVTKEKNPNGDTTTCVEQSVEIQIYLKKQAKKPKM